MEAIQKEVIENPADFLKKLIGKSEETTELVKTLYSQMRTAVDDFKSNGTVVLFRDESLNIKGERYHNVVPKPYYIIRGLEIVALGNDNNAFDRDNFCYVGTQVNLILEYDHTERKNFFREGEPVWKSPLTRVKFTEEIYNDNKYGLLERPHDGSSDTIILIENFSEFQKLKKVFQKGCTEIGLPDIGIASKNVNIIELKDSK